MKRFLIAFLSLSTFFSSLSAQITDPKATEFWEPQVRVVTPGEGTKPPSDAIILFDGSNFSEWQSAKDSTSARDRKSVV